MINVTKEHSDTHIKTLKEEILEDNTQKLMEKILDMVDQNVQDALKKFQTPKIKNTRRHRSKYMNSERTSTNTKVKHRTL
jgi:hypothetical protein